VPRQIDRHHAERVAQAEELIHPVARAHARAVDQEQRRSGGWISGGQTRDATAIELDEATKDRHANCE